MQNKTHLFSQQKNYTTQQTFTFYDRWTQSSSRVCWLTYMTNGLYAEKFNTKVAASLHFKDTE